MSDSWVDDVPEETPHLFVCDEGEWSALYIDGKLDKVGDTSNVEERIRELAGVVTLQTNDFLQGGSTRSDVAQTVDDLRAYRAKQQALKRETERLRAQAQELLDQADAMWRGGGQ